MPSGECMLEHTRTTSTWGMSSKPSHRKGFCTGLESGCVGKGGLAFWGHPIVPQVDGLNQQALLISQCWISGGRNQDVGRAICIWTLPYLRTFVLCIPGPWHQGCPPYALTVTLPLSSWTVFSLGVPVDVNHIRGGPTPGTSSKPNDI